jgi:hypothetical protein
VSTSAKRQKLSDALEKADPDSADGRLWRDFVFAKRSAEAAGPDQQLCFLPYQYRLIPVIGHDVAQEAPKETAATILELAAAATAKTAPGPRTGHPASAALSVAPWSKVGHGMAHAAMRADRNDDKRVGRALHAAVRSRTACKNVLSFMNDLLTWKLARLGRSSIGPPDVFLCAPHRALPDRMNCPLPPLSRV